MARNGSAGPRKSTKKVATKKAVRKKAATKKAVRPKTRAKRAETVASRNGHDPEVWRPQYICQGNMHAWDELNGRIVELNAVVYGIWLQCMACPVPKLRVIDRETGAIVESDFDYDEAPGYLNTTDFKPSRAEIRVMQSEHLEALDPREYRASWDAIADRATRKLERGW